MPKRRSRVQHLPEGDKVELSRSLDSSFMTVNTSGNLMAKTPQGALIAATTYLFSNQPPASDPRAALHRQPSPAWA